MIEINRTVYTKIFELTQEISKKYSIEGMILKAGNRDITEEQGQYMLQSYTGPIHYKENYLDTDPQLDLDESSYSDEGDHYLYLKMPNIVKVFKNQCKYEIQNRSNRDHIARVELVSINGNDVTHQINDEEFYFYPTVKQHNVGIWKELKLDRTGNTIFKQKINEIGSGGLYELYHKENIEAYDSLDQNIPNDEKTPVLVEGIKTRINDESYYFEEIVPKEAKLVDTHFYADADTNSGAQRTTGYFSNSDVYLAFGNYNTVGYDIFGRFEYINIPKNSTINSSYFTLLADTNRTETICNAAVYMVSEDNPIAPTSYAACTGLNLTTAIYQNSIPSWNDQVYYNTPSIHTLTQSIVNRSGQAQNNAMIIAIKNNGSSTNARRRAVSNEANPNSPALIITQTPPAYTGQSNKIIGISAGKVIGISKSNISRIIRT